MSRTLLTGTILRSGSIPTSALGGGVVSSSAQTVAHLENQVINVGAISASGHIVPTENEVYDLGSATKQFRDLYLSGSTIYLGGLKLTEENGGLAVKRTRRINDAIHDDPVAGVAPLSGSFTGSFYGNGTDIVGVQYTNLIQVPANIVSQSSQVILNSTTGTLEVNKGGTGHTTYTNGQLLIGNTESNTLTKATLTAGTGIIVTNGAGTITIAATSTGAVTSVSGTGTVSGLTLSGTVTSSGNLTLGGALSLTTEQVTSALGYTPYNATNPNGYTTNTGTVTSVAGTGTASGLTLSGTVTTSGNLTLSGTVNSLAAGTYAISISGNATTATSATTAGALSSMNISQFTNNSGYITGLSFDGLSSKGSGTGTYTTSGDFRAPIFYDSGNTGFYVDPASVSNINNLLIASAVTNANGGTRNVMPAGGIYTTSASSVSGAIVIKLPVTAFPMIRFTVKVYTYDGLSFDINCGGHTSSGIWYNTFAYMTTATRSALNVRFTYGDGEVYVYIGELGSSWSYPQVFITDVQVGYTSMEYTNWDDGWTITFNASTYKNVSSTHVVYPPMYSSNNTSAAYATIFYDSNDTTYYVDPNSTSQSALRIRGGALHGPNPTWGTYLLVGGDGRNNYIDNGSVASVCSTNGNLHMDAASGYSMYLNYYDGSSIHFGSGANGTWGEFSGGIFYAYNQMRSPIFYDYNNTGYYVDPASTSNLNSVSIITLNGHTLNADNYLGRYGGSYYQVNTWLQFNGPHGIYWPSYYGAHLYANTGSSYTQIRLDGQKNGYDGMWLSYSAVNGMMYDGAGNGGVYREANGRWYFYYHLGNDCMGIGTSATSSTYSLYLTKGVYAQSRIDATIFYDHNNTGYYVDPTSVSQLSYVLANDWFRPQGSTGLYFQDYGYGLRSAHGEGNSYGNATTYGTGRNGWSGWGIGSRHVFMSTTGDNVGVHDNSRGWIWYWNGSTFNIDHGFTNIAGSARSPIFYDNDNTGFYLDPNSTSVLATLNVNRLFIGHGNIGDPSNSEGQVFHKLGGGLGLAGIEIDCWTGFPGSSYPNNFQIGFRMSYDKRLYVWQDLIQYYSDERLKNKTGFLDGALDAIKNWTPFKYVDNDIAAGSEYTNRRPQIGLSAQEVQQYYPELVELAPFDMETDLSDPTNIRKYSKSGQNYLTLNYPRLIPVLIQAIKEQQAKIEALEAQINNL